MKLVILMCLLSVSVSHRLCNSNHYWSNDEELCLPCTKCPSHQLTMRPCQAHEDTVCKPMSNLSKLDFPWMKKHHKATVHFETDNVDDNDDDIYKDIFSKHLDSFEKPWKQKQEHHHKNKKHYSFKQRTNDKFLDDWDEEGWNRKHKKHFEFPSEKKHHKNVDIFDLSDDIESTTEKPKRHDFFQTDSKYRGNNHKKNVHRSKIEDEDILKQWLKQSKKQFKLKKDDLLKTLKEENEESDENSSEDESSEENEEQKKIKLNYPTHNEEEIENLEFSSHKEKQPKHLSDIDEQLFRDLIKNEETKKMDLSSLLSNKREPFPYKSSQRLYLGEPSTISEILGQVKDPEVIKEEIGRNVIYEKSRISVLPLSKEANEADVISVPFTAAERFVWDWQALALCSALFACLVFFIVVALYSIINARQWKRVKRNYSTELEEMSTRVALMHPTLEAVIPEIPPMKVEDPGLHRSQKH